MESCTKKILFFSSFECTDFPKILSWKNERHSSQSIPKNAGLADGTSTVVKFLKWRQIRTVFIKKKNVRCVVVVKFGNVVVVKERLKKDLINENLTPNLQQR